ncbi:MAG: biotin transporter BioY [Euryarchaeota archaeon]|jgi:biotin transport system substrate-specific component|nr:biotin transporter BioY [Euryarchaeota archaeon]MBT5661560.1 biotin transporter BioY [Euryarchaeota archaeon]
MFQHIAWKRPQQWHLGLSSNRMTALERAIAIGFFTALIALCAQFAILIPRISPVEFTLQTFAVMATGVYLRRNDAFAAGSLYVVLGAIGLPVFAGGGDYLFSEGALFYKGGYLLSFPIASALVAEGLDRSRRAGHADLKSQLICWTLAMIPVYVFGTLWLAHSLDWSLEAAFNAGTKPFLVWDGLKIFALALITTKVWTYAPHDEEQADE